MADGDALIQGQPGWLNNSSQTPTQIANVGTTSDGTGCICSAATTVEACMWSGGARTRWGYKAIATGVMASTL
jgi:hypothetical protein